MFDPATLLLKNNRHIYSHMGNKVQKRLFISELFIVTTDWKQFKCPSVDFLRPAATPREGGEGVVCGRVPEDRGSPHRLEPSRPVGLEQLRQLGVFYYKLDADNYENDPQLEKIRKERNDSWMDIITICKDKLPNYEEQIKMLFEEHIHLDDEIRYILEGSGYVDVRDKEDKWIRIFLEKGDMITMPAGMYHRFTLDEKNYAKAMRLFAGDPVWRAYKRPADHVDARKQYVKFLTQTE